MKRLKYIEIVLSVDYLWDIIDNTILLEINLSDNEFIQLIFDALHNELYNENSILDYIYYWVYGCFDENAYWRINLSGVLLTKLASYIDEFSFALEMNNSLIIDIIKQHDGCIACLLDKNTVILRF